MDITLLKDLVQAKINDIVDAPSYPDGLTQREMKVPLLVAEGKSNREIGEQLIISEGTARRHVSNVYNKIGPTNRAEDPSMPCLMACSPWSKRLRVKYSRIP